MNKKLGIMVASQDNMDHILGLTKAAETAGIQTEIFFTGDGVHLTRDSRFSELFDMARVAVCEVSYLNRGYKEIKIPGLGYKDFVTQSRNAEMVENCDRYLVM